MGGAGFAPAAPRTDSDLSHAKALFKNPPREYSTGPLWVWNDMLTEEQIRGTLRDLAARRSSRSWSIRGRA